ncbi:MAG: hypothetical protein QGG40_20380, partial [Myxococcota bacterium]|nr:hypothetical protein [Myxococcota bacterium]
LSLPETAVLQARVSNLAIAMGFGLLVGSRILAITTPLGPCSPPVRLGRWSRLPWSLLPLSRQVVQRALVVHGLVIVLASILVDLGAYLVMGWVLPPDDLVDLGSVLQVSVMFPTLLLLVLLPGLTGQVRAVVLAACSLGLVACAVVWAWMPGLHALAQLVPWPRAGLELSLVTAACIGALALCGLAHRVDALRGTYSG